MQLGGDDGNHSQVGKNHSWLLVYVSSTASAHDPLNADAAVEKRCLGRHGRLAQTILAGDEKTEGGVVFAGRAHRAAVVMHGSLLMVTHVFPLEHRAWQGHGELWTERLRQGGQHVGWCGGRLVYAGHHDESVNQGRLVGSHESDNS